MSYSDSKCQSRLNQGCVTRSQLKHEQHGDLKILDLYDKIQVQKEVSEVHDCFCKECGPSFKVAPY